MTTGAVVHAFDETSGPAAEHGQIDTERWAGLAEAVLGDEGIPYGELGLRFVDPGVMAELNLAHMGAPGPTDVLAFPIDGGNGGAPASEPAVLLGDVVVCPEYVEPRPPGDLAESADPRPPSDLAESHDPRSPSDLAESADPRSPSDLAEYVDPRSPSDLADELALLVVHGVLHVLGYDHAHDAEAAAMRAREQQLLAAHYRQP